MLEEAQLQIQEKDEWLLKGLGEKVKNRWSTGDFLGSEIILCDIVILDMWHMFGKYDTEYISQRVNFTVNYGLHLWFCIAIDSSVVANTSH